MNDAAEQLSQQYLEALKAYLADRNERALHQAYELGRKTMADGFGVIDMAKIHEDVLLSLLPRSPSAQETFAITKSAGTFLNESLSPFEITHRGFRDSNQSLRRVNEALEERNHQLATSNQRLKREISERKRVERELRESEEHYRLLFNQAKLMQENLHYLSSQILNVQEDERKRISRELHDEVGQALTAINVNLAMLGNAIEGNRAPLRKKIADAQALLAHTMESVHNFSKELRPAMLDDLGLIPALRSFVKGFSERTHVRIRFDAVRDAERLEIEQKTVLYRVAQESLTNVARHAAASRGALILRKVKRGMQMEIRDNGRSFRVDRQMAPGKKRLGLLGIHERVRLVNGTCQVESFPGRGTCVRVWIPFKLGGVDHHG